jgi:hypothetical protein
VVWGIVDEDASSGMRSKLMRGCCRQVGVIGTFKDLKILLGRRCVVEGDVRTGGSDDIY